MSLRLRISLYFAFLFTLIFVIIFFIFRKEEIRYLEKGLEKEAEMSVSSLAVTCKDFLLEERVPDLVKLCYEVKEKGTHRKDILYTFVVDINGVVKGAWREEFVGKNIEEIGVFLSDTNFFYKDREFVFNRVSEVVYKDKVIGKAIVGVSSRTLNILVDKMQRRMLILFFLILLAGVMGIFLVGTHITKPVRKIIKSIGNIGRGEFDVSIGIKRRDEIGKIAKEIEIMGKKLKIAQKETQEKERMRRDMEISREIQKALVPSEIPKIQDYELSIFYKPAFFVSGDYIDIIKLPFERTFVILGDVSGKGAGSSLLMGMIKMNVLSLARTVSSPKNLLVSIYNYMKDLIPEDMFVTLAVGLLEKGGNINISNAGHFPPLIYRKNESKFERVELKSLPVGFSFLDVGDFAHSLKEKKIVLEKGDTLIFYTDGLIEARNDKGEIFGEKRLKKIVYSSDINVEELKNKIVKEIDMFVGLEEQKDDVSFIIIRRK